MGGSGPYREAATTLASATLRASDTTQPPCVFHPSPSGPSHVLLTNPLKKRVFHSASAKQGPKISGPLVSIAISFPSLFFFPLLLPLQTFLPPSPSRSYEKKKKLMLVH